jgi:hypothetical protein
MQVRKSLRRENAQINRETAWRGVNGSNGSLFTVDLHITTFTMNRIARIWLGLSIHAEQPVGQYDVVLHSHTKGERRESDSFRP